MDGDDAEFGSVEGGGDEDAGRPPTKAQACSSAAEQAVYR